MPHYNLVIILTIYIFTAIFEVDTKLITITLSLFNIAGDIAVLPFAIANFFVGSRACLSYKLVAYYNYSYWNDE